MSTATPIVDEANGTYYFVRRQGAGLANIGNAVKSGAYITVEGTDKAKLELGDDAEKTGKYEMKFSVVNFSKEAKTYALSLQGLARLQRAASSRAARSPISRRTMQRSSTRPIPPA